MVKLKQDYKYCAEGTRWILVNPSKVLWAYSYPKSDYTVTRLVMEGEEEIDVVGTLEAVMKKFGGKDAEG